MSTKEGRAGLQDLEGSNLDCAMAQHLLVAADRFQLPRLRRICERRLCETVEVLPASSSVPGSNSCACLKHGCRVQHCVTAKS